MLRLVRPAVFSQTKKNRPCRISAEIVCEKKKRFSAHFGSALLFWVPALLGSKKTGFPSHTLALLLTGRTKTGLFITIWLSGVKTGVKIGSCPLKIGSKSFFYRPVYKTPFSAPKKQNRSLPLKPDEAQPSGNSSRVHHLFDTIIETNCTRQRD